MARKGVPASGPAPMVMLKGPAPRMVMLPEDDEYIDKVIQRHKGVRQSKKLDEWRKAFVKMLNAKAKVKRAKAKPKK
jgi:hypothetical protein